MRKIVLVLILLPLFHSSTLVTALAVDYRSNNYQVIVEPITGTPFSPEPTLVEISGTGTTAVRFEYDSLIPSNYATPPLSAIHKLSTTFFESGSIYLLMDHRPLDQSGLALAKWTDKNNFGLGYNLGYGKYLPPPSKAELETPVKIKTGSGQTDIHFVVNYPTSKREFTYTSRLNYLIVPDI